MVGGEGGWLGARVGGGEAGGEAERVKGREAGRQGASREGRRKGGRERLRPERQPMCQFSHACICTHTRMRVCTYVQAREYLQQLRARKYQLLERESDAKSKMQKHKERLRITYYTCIIHTFELCTLPKHEA